MRTPCFQFRVHKFDPWSRNQDSACRSAHQKRERKGLPREQRRWEGAPGRGPLSKACFNIGSFCVRRSGNAFCAPCGYWECAEYLGGPRWAGVSCHLGSEWLTWEHLLCPCCPEPRGHPISKGADHKCCLSQHSFPLRSKNPRQERVGPGAVQNPGQGVPVPRVGLATPSVGQLHPSQHQGFRDGSFLDKKRKVGPGCLTANSASQGEWRECGVLVAESGAG